MTRVLIVDDDDGWGRLARRRLERAGFDATFHLGSLGALKVICTGGYDLLLLDVKMPALDGPRIAHVLYHVRTIQRPKLVLCSSMDTAELKILARQLKADGFLSKSTGSDKFVEFVRRLLAAPAGERVSGVVENKSADTAACPVCGMDFASGQE